MRTVKHHATVGYELPEHRDSCRHCKQRKSVPTRAELAGDVDERRAHAARWVCKVHKFDIQLSGVCPDFKRNGPTFRPPQIGERDDKTADMFNTAA
jgi:hypothetical protein